MKAKVLTSIPGGEGIVEAYLDVTGLISVDVNAGETISVLSVGLDSFISMQIGLTSFNKVEAKCRIKMFTIVNIGSDLFNTNTQNMGSSLFFDVVISKDTENMNIEIKNNNSYNITVSIMQKVLGN